MLPVKAANGPSRTRTVSPSRKVCGPRFLPCSSRKIIFNLSSDMATLLHSELGTLTDKMKGKGAYFIILPPSSFLPRLRLHGSDGDGVNDVFGLAAARAVVGRTVESLQDWADGRRAGEPLGQFVSDVAGLQVWEDENVGAARDRGAGRFRLADLWDERGVGLQFAVNFEFGLARAHRPCRLD